MYNIIYGIKFKDKLDDFILSYLNTFLKLFTDTGIEDENFIREGYIKLSEKLQVEIFDSIEEILRLNIVFGRTCLNDGRIMIIIPINSFRLFIYYKEDDKIKERYIEDIEFFKK